MTHSPHLDRPRDPSQEVRIPADALTSLLTSLLVKKGMFAAEAKIGALRMVEADMRGLTSHGSRLLKLYLDAMDAGDIDPRAQIVPLTETAAIGVLDGGKGLGHVAATRAIELAIEKASRIGTGTVCVRRGQHFGAAAVYLQLAIDAGMIGYCTSSTGTASVAAYGSRTPVTSNHPIAWGVPNPNGSPLMIDMSTGEISWGKLMQLKHFGLALPEGVGLTEAGEETTDPAATKTMRPMGGPRGFGLGLVSAVLAGPLIGGKLPMEKRRFDLSDSSEHFFYVIDPAHFGDPARMFERLERGFAEIAQLEPEPGFDRVRIPGQRQWEHLQDSRENGIPLHRRQVERLRQLAENDGIEIPW